MRADFATVSSNYQELSLSFPVIAYPDGFMIDGSGIADMKTYLITNTGVSTDVSASLLSLI